MKMLVRREVTSSQEAVHLNQLKLHLRVDHNEDDGAIIAMGSTAAAEVEHVAQIALLPQTILVTVLNPCLGDWFRLPIGPASDASSVSMTLDGVAFAGFELIQGLQPQLLFLEADWPANLRRMDVSYRAGFEGGATSIPSDLQQAIIDQTAAHYDGRTPMDRRDLSSSPHMARIAARYRGVSL